MPLFNTELDAHNYVNNLVNVNGIPVENIIWIPMKGGLVRVSIKKTNTPTPVKLTEADVLNWANIEAKWIKPDMNQMFINPIVETTGTLGKIKLNNPFFWHDDLQPPKPPITNENIPIKEEPLMEKKEPIILSKINISDRYKYKGLSKYEGLEGKIPVRAGTTFVGVEIELEHVVYNRVPTSVWNATNDGSLKENGVEFVSVPIQFKYLEIELERLFKAIKEKKVTDRCSVHVHLNARDFTFEELKSFIALYAIFERSLYRFSGDRWNSIFCVPLAFTEKLVKEFIRKLDLGMLSETWFKYLGFNISPIFGGESSKIGTIEFRHMKGTTDVEYIINWINLIVSLKITAKKIPWIEIEEHLRTMNTTSAYYWLAEQTFKEFSELVTKQPTFKQDVEAGITSTKNKMLTEKDVEEVLNVVFATKGK